MTKHTLNEMAGASALGTLLAIFITGLILGVLYFALQKSQTFFTGLSGDGSNTISTLEILFVVAVPVILLIVFVINHLINEKSDANQGV